MNQKLFISLIIILFSICSFSICLANDNTPGIVTAANEVRNFVGGVEDTVENAALDISNTSKNITSGTENIMNRNYDSEMNNSNSMFGTTRNGNYTATKTDTSVMGMSQNAWTWLIIGIAAIAIIAVIWYYSMQFTNSERNNNDDKQ